MRTVAFVKGSLFLLASVFSIMFLFLHSVKANRDAVSNVNYEADWHNPIMLSVSFVDNSGRVVKKVEKNFFPYAYFFTDSNPWCILEKNSDYLTLKKWANLYRGEDVVCKVHMWISHRDLRDFVRDNMPEDFDSKEKKNVLDSVSNVSRKIDFNLWFEKKSFYHLPSIDLEYRI